jgi:peptidoglycan hydrolase-like protein with peptidoglycan-binding domain
MPTATTTSPSLGSAASCSDSGPCLEALLAQLQTELQVLLKEAAAKGITIPGITLSSTSTFTFTRNLTIGSRGPDVAVLQHYLNTHGFPVVSTPGYAGSLGYETQYFGIKTQNALAKFQESVGISPSTGFFGPITRAYIQAH